MSDIPTFGIAVDAYCSGNPGKAGYRGIDLETGEILFQNTLALTTNNVAEFLAAIHGLMYCKKHKKHNQVYTDSQTAMAWINKERVNSSFNHNDRIKNLIKRSIMWLSEQKMSVRLYKWKTKEWGEIPADYGNK